MKWEILDKGKKKYLKKEDIVKILLKNRGLTSKKDIDEFLNPVDPKKIKITDLGITKQQLSKVLVRLKKAKKNRERVVIFGDYDADGVCATAILWETLYKQGFDALPYIPDRFEEGYGIKASTFDNERFKKLEPKLIITVDNGIVAYEGIKRAKEMGIDMVVVDHHQKGKKKIETNLILHSTLVCGSALSWFLSRELGGKEGLDLVTIGTIADQMPLLGINRSLVKFGLPQLNQTKRVGLKAILKTANITNVGVYEIGFIIAPRINAMGRLSNALDSLRILCTNDVNKANELALTLNQTNIERQRVVDQVLQEVLNISKEDGENSILVLSGKYHEGVIGLASGKITERFYKPSIVISLGEKISKASARSIVGFNIIEAIKKTEIILEGGGHPMAAGFSIETSRILEFSQKINLLSKDLLTQDLLEKKLTVDVEISFSDINQELINLLKEFEPYGNSNPASLFTSCDVKVVGVKTVGADGKHLKLKLQQGNIKFDAIAFGKANEHKLNVNDQISVVYSIEENLWDGIKSIQLKVKDIKIT